MLPYPHPASAGTAPGRLKPSTSASRPPALSSRGLKPSLSNQPLDSGTTRTGHGTPRYDASPPPLLLRCRVATADGGRAGIVSASLPHTAKSTGLSSGCRSSQMRRRPAGSWRGPPPPPLVLLPRVAPSRRDRPPCTVTNGERSEEAEKSAARQLGGSRSSQLSPLAAQAGRPYSDGARYGGGVSIYCHLQHHGGYLVKVACARRTPATRAVEGTPRRHSAAVAALMRLHMPPPGCRAIHRARIANQKCSSLTRPHCRLIGMSSRPRGAAEQLRQLADADTHQKRSSWRHGSIIY